MNNTIYSTIHQIYQLLTASQGNIFNCIYIECSSCINDKSSFCSDFIFSTGQTGSPILLPVKDVNTIKGFSQDKADYLGILTNKRFNDLFYLFFTENIDSFNKCPISSLFLCQNTIDYKNS